VADEPRFRTEHKAAYAGMQPVSSDNKVHGAGRRPCEVDVHHVVRLGQVGDRVAEKVLGPPSAVLVEHPGQVAAVHLDVAAGELGRQSEDLSAVLVHAAHRAAVGLDTLQFAEYAHPPQHLQVRGPTEVHGEAAGAQRGCDFHHGDVGAVAPQPVRKRRTGNTSARDEDPGAAQRLCVGHGPAPFSRESIVSNGHSVR
jgi:hypothetical protein